MGSVWQKAQNKPCDIVKNVIYYRHKKNKEEDMDQENKEQENQKDNIWDIMFKVILQEMPQMAIPLINEAFHENYGMDAEILSLNNEFYNADGSKVVSDTSFMIDEMLYHFECQFSNDKEMAFRMFEYDFHIAVAGTKGEKRIDELVFPKSCVIYITTNKNNPTKLNMKIIFPNGEFIYEVPTLRVHDYTFENISKKNLLIFLPYMALRFPQKLKSKEPPTIEVIKQFYDEMINVLGTAYNGNVIEQWEYNLLLEMIQDVEERIFHDYPEIKKEVDSMVAQLVNYESLRMKKEFDQKIIELEQQKRETEQQAAKKASLTNIEMLKQFGITLTEEQIQIMLKQAEEHLEVKK